MRSLVNYQKNNNYFNSLQSKLENPIIESFEDLFKYHGSEFDNILHKLSIYNYRCANPNFIHESTKNVYFTLEESYAARNFLISIVSEYERSLYEEFCNEHNIIITEGLDSIKNFYGKIKDAVKSGDSKAIEGFKALGEKVKQLKDFIKDVLNNVIKTAKDLFNRVTSMMISIGTSLVNLIKKLGGKDNIEEFETMYNEMGQEALKAQLKAKENVFESFHNEYIEQINEGIKDKLKSFGSKLKQGAKGFIKNLPQMGIKLLLQQMAFYAVTVGIPIIVGCAAGPAAAAITELVLKAIWSASTIYKQIKGMVDFVKSPEYKNTPGWVKTIRWVLFGVSMYFSIKTAGTVINDGAGIVKQIAENGFKHILPSDAVQKGMEIFNDFWKNLTGSNTKGWDAMELVKNTKLDKELEKLNPVDKENNFEANKTDLKKVSNYEDLKKIFNGDEKLASEMRDRIINGEFKSSQQMLDAFNNIPMQDTGNLSHYVVDGIASGKARKAMIDDIIKENPNLKPENIHITQISNPGLVDSSNGMGGISFLITINSPATDELNNSMMDAVKDISGGFCKCLSKPGGGLEKAIEQIPIENFVNTFSWVGGFFPIKIKGFGGFKMRLGSEGTGNHIYNIPDNAVKTIKYSEFISKYGNLNPKVISNMEKMIDEKVAALESSKSELENKKQLSKDDKKFLKQLTENLEKAKELKSESPIYVFFTDDELASKASEMNKVKSKDKSKNESYHELLGLYDNEENIFEGSSDLYPVAFINPIVIAGGDLAPIRKNKKSRANMYFLKGLLSRLQFINNGGMSEEEILDTICEIFENSVKECFIMSADIPCIKDGKEYIVNEKSKYGADKKRKDFGDFTNNEITDIFNTKDMQDKLAEFLGGQHASDSLSGGKHDYNEQSDTERKKKHKEKRQKIYKDILSEDKDVQKFLDKHEDIKDLLYTDGELDDEKLDKISIYFERFENTYRLKKKIKKDGIFSKVKRWFTGEKKDKIESKDFLKFVELVISKRRNIEDKKRRKKSKKSKEEIQKENNNLDYNIVNENEYDDYDDIDESIDDLIFLNINMKDLLEDYYENHE